MEIFHSSDPDRPGVGVAAQGEVEAPGAPAGGAGGGQQVGGAVGGSGSGTSSPARPRNCTVHHTSSRLSSVAGGLAGLVGGEGADARSRPLAPGSLVAGQGYHRHCDYADGGGFDHHVAFVHDPGGAGPVAGPAAAPLMPSVLSVAEQVYAELELPLPEPRMSPPLDAVHLVGLPVELRLDGAGGSEEEPGRVSASASLGGVTVGVTAVLAEARWEMGDGQVVTCAASGLFGSPFDAGGPGACRYTYRYVSVGEPEGRYGGAVTTVWSVDWSATTGESGEFPDVHRRSTFGLDVRQRQAVIEVG